MHKYLIINADDFGVDRPTTDGIIDSHLRGVVTSTSAMTNCDDFNYAMDQLRGLTTLKCGVHLNFYQGVPVLPPELVSSLICQKSGRFSPDIHASGQIDPIQLKAEFRAQIEKFRASGVEPTHLDNHRPEIYLNYALFKVVLELAVEFNLPIRMPFDLAFTKGDQTLCRLSGAPWEKVQSLGRLIRLDLVREGIRVPDYFIYSFTAGTRTEESLIEIIRRLPIGISEICTHPGFRGDRQTTELNVLKSQVIREEIRRQDIQLVSFDVFRSAQDGGAG